MNPSDSAGELTLSVGELIALYRLLKASPYLEDPFASAAYKKIEGRIFATLSLEEITSLAEGAGGALA